MKIELFSLVILTFLTRNLEIPINSFFFLKIYSNVPMSKECEKIATRLANELNVTPSQIVSGVILSQSSRIR